MGKKDDAAKRLTEKYSARIKNLYVELNDYAYFHSPSEIDDIDPRFTGRREVLERLKSLFTDHQTPSGAYLVTGYRGAGKSSLVARALSEISAGHHRRRRGSRYLRLLMPLVPVALLGGIFANPWGFGALAALATGILIALFRSDPSFPDRLKGKVPAELLRREELCCLLRCLYLSEEREPRRRARILAQDVLVLLLILLAGGSTVLALDLHGFWPRLFIYLTWLLLYLGGNAFLGKLAQNSVDVEVEPDERPPLPEKPVDSAHERLGSRPWGEAFLQALRQARRALKNRFRYANRVYIKVNLSQDDIQEVDILRLIAKNIYVKYREFVRGWRSDLHWKLLRLVVLVLVVGVIYNLSFVYKLNHGLKHDLHLACYFPSQGAYLLEGGHRTYFEKLDELLENGTFDAENLRERLEKAAELKSSEEAARLRQWEHAFDHPTFSWGLPGALQEMVMNATTYVDTFVQLIFHKTVPKLTLPAWLHSLDLFEIRLLRSGMGLPQHVDYLFFFYLVAFGLLSQAVLRWPRLGVMSHRVILRRLEELNEMIETQVTREQGGVPVPGSLLTFSFGRRRSRTSTTLNARDIEKHLLEILGMIERIPRLTVRPEFIVVFDELDKIQHHVNFTVSEKEEELEEYQGREFASMEAERARQHRILSLVSNLKHFLTTAPAKFIFIAGREMFDAALADVSDRHFFMGSVFNEVLHVPSFHSDGSDDRLPDITSLTEQYLCRFLLPRRLWRRGICLRTYHQYLQDELLRGEEHAPVREKVIYELHNFITYVTYRSNGAPKKITKVVERYLMRLRTEISEHPDSLVVGRSSRSFYLYFEYYDQYTFALITYLGSPLIFALNRAIKDYGDKILVSSSFLLDHIYKFHGHGFSWRNLELLPEIVDINRAPQLRELIGYIMDFLGKSDITEIASGLYDFKFNRRIVEEISFLSKISEHESAAFNFTLDESLAIKRHFNHKLQVLLRTYGSYPNREPNKFVNSIAFVRMILGDLHFYDGELDAAIIEYMEAVQSLREVETKDLRLDILVLMVRNFLKLGLAFERKKSFDSAFVTYGRIAAMIAELGEKSDFSGKLSTAGDRLPLHPAKRSYGQTIFEGSRLICQPMYARLQLAEKATLGGISQSDVDGVVKDFEHIVRPGREGERHLLASEFKNKVADILYFKNGPVAKKKDGVYCRRADALCNVNPAWQRLVQEDRRALPCAACAFYHGALEVLCKSYLGIEKHPGPQVMVKILEAFEAKAIPKTARLNSLLELAGTLSDLGNVYLSCSGARTIDGPFLIAILELLQKPTKCGPRRSEQLRNAAERLKTKRARLVPCHERAIRTRVGKLKRLKKLQRRGRLPGGTALRAVELEELALMIQIQERLQLADRRARDQLEQGLNKIEEALVCYMLSAIIYRWAANSRACAQELTKILWVLREHLATSARGKRKLREKLRKAIEGPLVRTAIEENYRSHEGTHRLEIEKLKEILELPGKERPFVESVNLGRLSINSSITEILVVLDEIRLTAAPAGEPYPIDARCSPSAMFHSVFSRIHALRLRARINFHNLRALGLVASSGKGGETERNGEPPPLDRFVYRKDFETEDRSAEAKKLREFLDASEGKAKVMFPSSKEPLPRHGILEFLITDSIYCCHEIIRFMAIYGSSYMASHSMRAAAHENMAGWCDYYYAYLRVQKERPGSAELVRNLEKKLQRLVGQADMVDLSPSYHGEMALLHYRAAREAHSEGKAYDELIDKMFYLNDDFADQLEHFCAALERFRINSGAVDKAIGRWKHRLRSTTIYAPERYETAGGTASL